MNIDSIHSGYVLDHIKAGKAMDVYKFLKLDQMDCPVAIIKNVRSTRMGKKDIIKIDADIPVDYNVLGYIDPGITVNVIRNDVRVDKAQLHLPARLVNVIHCKNPRCITSIEQEIDHVFRLADEKKRMYRCVYCEAERK